MDVKDEEINLDVNDLAEGVKEREEHLWLNGYCTNIKTSLYKQVWLYDFSIKK